MNILFQCKLPHIFTDLNVGQHSGCHTDSTVQQQVRFPKLKFMQVILPARYALWFDICKCEHFYHSSCFLAAVQMH